MYRSVHDETKSVIGDKVFTNVIVKITEKIVRVMHSGNSVLNTIDFIINFDQLLQVCF